MSEAVGQQSMLRVPIGEASQSPSTGAQPIRVLHVHAGNMYGGVEAMLLTQVRGRDLCPGMDSSFALCFAGRFSEELAAEGASVYQLGEVKIRQPLSVRRARQKLRELLRRQVFDVVVTHSCWSQAIFGPAARAAGVPLVFYQHGPANGRHWLERWARRTVPDAVICNSEFTAATLSELYAGIHAETVYCPVAPLDVNNSEKETAETRAELQTAENATVIIQVSRMEAWKGHAPNLEALGLLKDLPGWMCWMVGGAQAPSEKEYLQELKEMARGLGIGERVRFLEERTDVPRLLAAADVFCQPNTGPEPFGIAFIEAMYAQLPIVTTELGGACEVVDDSCGILVTPGDAQALAEALESLIKDQGLRLRLGSAGPSRARALCDPSAQMNRFHGSLANAIQRKGMG